MPLTPMRAARAVHHSLIGVNRIYVLILTSALEIPTFMTHTFHIFSQTFEQSRTTHFDSFC